MAFHPPSFFACLFPFLPLQIEMHGTKSAGIAADFPGKLQVRQCSWALQHLPRPELLAWNYSAGTGGRSPLSSLRCSPTHSKFCPRRNKEATPLAPEVSYLSRDGALKGGNHGSGHSLGLQLKAHPRTPTCFLYKTSDIPPSCSPPSFLMCRSDRHVPNYS